MSFPYKGKPDKMLWFSGALEDSYGNQDHRHHAGIIEMKTYLVGEHPDSWVQKQTASFILNKNLIIFSIEHLSFGATLSCTSK